MVFMHLFHMFSARVDARAYYLMLLPFLDEVLNAVWWVGGNISPLPLLQLHANRQEERRFLVAYSIHIL